MISKKKIIWTISIFLISNFYPNIQVYIKLITVHISIHVEDFLGGNKCLLLAIQSW